MAKELIKSKAQWKSLLKKLQKDGTGDVYETEEVCPRLYPVIVVYSYSQDIEFGHIHQIDFVYLTDFTPPI